MSDYKPWSVAIAAAMRLTGQSVWSDGWPGVVLGPVPATVDGCPASGLWRVVLTRSARYYRLQSKERGDAQFRTVRRGESLSGLLRPRRGGHVVLQGVDAAQVAALDDLAFGHVVVARSLGAALPPRAARDYWLAGDYPGVLRQDGNVRVVIDRTGRSYGLQWVPVGQYRASEEGEPVSRWVTQMTGETLTELAGFVSKAFDSEEGHGPEAKEAIQERFAVLVSGLPELAADGPWPVLPPWREPHISKRSRKRESV